MIIELFYILLLLQFIVRVNQLNTFTEVGLFWSVFIVFFVSGLLGNEPSEVIKDYKRKKLINIYLILMIVAYACLHFLTLDRCFDLIDYGIVAFFYVATKVVYISNVKLSSGKIDSFEVLSGIVSENKDLINARLKAFIIIIFSIFVHFRILFVDLICLTFISLYHFNTLKIMSNNSKQFAEFLQVIKFIFVSTIFIYCIVILKYGYINGIELMPAVLISMIYYISATKIHNKQHQQK